MQLSGPKSLKELLKQFLHSYRQYEIFDLISFKKVFIFIIVFIFFLFLLIFVAGSLLLLLALLLRLLLTTCITSDY